ncbi:MAG TPA: efflux RND transporter permease subunit, partial [Candidatus Polarisedimenticolaceae bacterium]|nr:efflux RND transporter permease subunit [Candidatus Polarisedimenticolaceae bacterium]
MSDESRFGTSFITSRPVAILMVFLAAVVFGALSFDRLPVTLMPELSYPTITVRTEYPGSAPEEVENDISRPIEESVGVIGGLKKLSSISRAGVSDVVLEFAWDSEMSDATQDVLEKLDLVFLPEEAKRPLILHYDPALDPVMELSLSGEGRRFEGEAGLRRLRRLADLRVKKELEPIKGVAAVRVRGGLEEEIHVRLEEEALRRSGISIQQVIDRLAQENINVAGGTLQEGRTEYLVRTLNEYEDLEQIAATVVTRLDGREVRLRDLGQVLWANKEREIVTRTDGGESVQIEIFKEGDANIVALAQRVKAAIGELDLEAEAPATAAAARGGEGGQGSFAGLAAAIFAQEGARLQLVADRSLFIDSSIDEVINTAIIGGLLAVFILYLFLRNFQSTAIVAISIPISLLITFAPLNLLGVSLNIMSLGGLALGVGMLVDSSIVVLESIYRCREEGDEVETAANRGTAEVRGAVFASTMTSVAVFFPMVFVEGIAGQAFGDLGLAVVVSLLASAAVALFFVPMLSGRPGLGLSVAVGFAATLLAVWLALNHRPAFLVTIAAIGLLLIVGFLYSLYLAISGKLAVDPTTRKLLGIWNWASWRAFRRGLGWPVHATRSLVRRRRRATGGRLRALAVLPRLAAGLLMIPVSLLYWSYLLVVRLVAGSLFEWLGKTVVIAFLGLVASSMRFHLPLLGRLLAALSWLPLRLTGGVLERLHQSYPGVIRLALAHPLAIVVLVIACLWGSWQVARSLESELLPEVHQGEFTVEVRFPVGTPLDRTERVVAPIEQAILAEK